MTKVLYHAVKTYRKQELAKPIREWCEVILDLANGTKNVLLDAAREAFDGVTPAFKFWEVKDSAILITDGEYDVLVSLKVECVRRPTPERYIAERIEQIERFTETSVVMKEKGK